MHREYKFARTVGTDFVKEFTLNCVYQVLQVTPSITLSHHAASETFNLHVKSIRTGIFNIL